MLIDPKVNATPFADISDQSHFESEAEVLFSMHAVFRINEIKKLRDSDTIFEVHLTLTSDDDKELRIITDLFEEELKGGTGWERLGNILIKVHKLDKAEELYLGLLKQATEEIEEASYNHHLGCIQT
ncbi:unnamed protein product [Rotaria sp. Silwood2]|nr:unnamed protein product [Rotaria sp. Silwood2]